MPATRSFERLVTRLVYRDAAKTYGVLVVSLSFVALWLEKAWPPREIRSTLVHADPWLRGALLGAVLGAYLVATGPVVRILIASERLNYLRHLPVSRARWRRLQGIHLLAVNGPALAVVMYGLAAPGDQLLGDRWLCGIAWISLMLTTQLHAVIVATASHRIIGLVAALAVAFLLAAGSEFVGAQPLWRSGGLVLVLASSVYLWRKLGTPPAEPDGRVWRWPWPRKSRCKSPWLALLSLDLRALLRRAPQRLRRRLLLQIAALTITAAALVAAARVGMPGDPWIMRVMLGLGCLAGASSVLVAHRLVDRDRWYLDALPIDEWAQLVARLIVGLIGTAPTVLGVFVVVVFIGGVPVVASSIEIAALALLAVALTIWSGFRAEAKRRLHERASGGPAFGILLALVFLQLTDSGLALLPIAALVLVAAKRQVGPANQARRRLETSRRDDDHATAL